MKQKFLKIDPVFCFAITAIVTLKLVLMGLFSSDYQDLMFVPFVKTFLNGNNPYDYYFQHNLLDSFPYPPLMLLIESVFGWGSAQFSNLFLFRVVFKLPILIFDSIGFYYLRKLCPFRKKYILILYFLSPIVLFSCYMHGQLDIIPTSILVMSVYYLTSSSRTYSLHLSGVLLGCALATKLHILAAVPIVFLYVMKKYDWKKAVVFVGEALLVLLAFILPFYCQGFLDTVLLNKEQSALIDVVLDYRQARLLLSIVVISVIYLRAYQLAQMTKELLLSILGVMFSVFLMCMAPMPGWFVWIVPYVFLYFASVYDNKYKMLTIYGGFNLLYLVYFLLFHETGFVTLYAGTHSLEALKLHWASASDVVFSVLVSMLAVIVWNMYQYGMVQNSLYRRGSTPFTIGIAGDSGTGKSELLEKIEDTLGRDKILHIEGDGDHRWERGSSDWEKYTHLDPRANYLYRQAEDISILRAGSMVTRVDYDHKTGRFTEQKRIKPKPYIILCGLHPLFLPKSREALDLKIYMDTDEKLRRFWKIKRDTTTRGYSSEKIVEQIEKRIPDAEKYIYPQKQYADLVITYFDPTLEVCDALDHQVVICLQLTMDISINTESLIEALNQLGVKVVLEYSQDLRHQVLTIDLRNARLDPKALSSIADEVVSHYTELFRSHITWHDGIDGILQLVILEIISEKMRGM